MPDAAVLERIRAATRPCHDALERELNVLERLTQAQSRLALMRAYYCMYAKAEAALEAHLHNVAGLHFESRRKAAMLLGDLRAIGARSEKSRVPLDEVPAIPDTAYAMGFAYVLEGASLGGRVIKKRAAAAGVPVGGLRFFDVYGAATAQKWKEFCVVLERECADLPQQAVSGAVHGFAYARTALLDGTQSSAAMG